MGMSPSASIFWGFEAKITPKIVVEASKKSENIKRILNVKIDCDSDEEVLEFLEDDLYEHLDILDDIFENVKLHRFGYQYEGYEHIDDGQVFFVAKEIQSEEWGCSELNVGEINERPEIPQSDMETLQTLGIKPELKVYVSNSYI